VDGTLASVVLALAATARAADGGAAGAAPLDAWDTPVRIQPGGESVAVHAATYAALLGADGNLRWLRAGDLDLLAAAPGEGPAAAFVTLDGRRAELPRRRVQDTTLSTWSRAYRADLAFSPQSLVVRVRNDTAAEATYRLLLPADARTVSTPGALSVHYPGELRVVVAGELQSGRHEGRPVLETAVPPGRSRQFTLRVLPAALLAAAAAGPAAAPEPAAPEPPPPGPDAGPSAAAAGPRPPLGESSVPTEPGLLLLAVVGALAVAVLLRGGRRGS
jgi:hypothetical protein